MDVASIRLALVALIQASRQLFEKPPFDPSLGRRFHSCLHIIRNTERCGLLRVSIWIGLSAIGSRMVIGNSLASGIGPTPWLSFGSSSIAIVVTRQLLRPDAHIPKADRGGLSAPRLLWRRGLIRIPADQSVHGCGNMVNGSLMSLLALLLCAPTSLR
jgi:hypothetical protein